LIKQLEDTSVERKLVDPIETINKLHDILATTHITTNEEIGKLKSPFEYLSAEEMPENNDLLYFLYSTNLPWLRNIENFGNMIISGPRGCGKSMILKNLRWQTKLTSKEYRNENFSKDHYIGFYLHCHHALYLPFAGIYIDYSKTEIQEAFIHYINLLFTHEVIQTLKIVEGHNILDFTDSFKEKLVDFIEKNVLTTKIALLENVNMFSYLSTIIEKKTTYIQKCIIESKIPTKLSRLNYINELCNLLINNIPYFREKKIYFILDDYSHPKVRFEIQKAFNRILGVRNSLYCFKISSEKFSFVPSDYDLDGVKKTFQQDREFSYTDLGGKYLTYKKDIELRNFIELIINKRIERCSELNSKDTESIFGNFELPLGGIPNALIIDRNYRKGKKKRRSEKRQILYAGIKSIYSLCGGDIATILQLCKEIYDIAVNSQRVNLTSENIPFEIQDRVIKEFSKRRLERIKEIFNWGQKCYDIIESFGEISKAYLYNYGKITKEKNRYYEVMKIEITDSGQLNDEAHELYKTLIQEGIFTDEGGKYPWGKGILNNSLVLRPIYTPALQISYRRRECLRMSTLKFSQFMLYPKNFRKIGTKFLKDHLGHTTELLREIDDLPLFEKKN
jgi:hypothetical protein